MNVKASLAVAALALAAAAAPAQAATHHQHKAKHAKSGLILRRAFAQDQGASQIMHWRVQVDPAGHPPGLAAFTDDQWMHVTAAGQVDVLHELRLDGPYQGNETVTTEPDGDLAQAVTKDRQGASSPIRTSAGVGYDPTLASVVTTSLQGSHPNATEVTFEGHDAWQILLRPAATTPHPGQTSPDPGEISITMWIDKASNTPLAVRWGEGATLWRTEHIVAYEQSADDAAHQGLLNFQ